MCVVSPGINVTLCNAAFEVVSLYQKSPLVLRMDPIFIHPLCGEPIILSKNASSLLTS